MIAQLISINRNIKFLPLLLYMYTSTCIYKLLEVCQIKIIHSNLFSHGYEHFNDVIFNKNICLVRLFSLRYI